MEYKTMLLSQSVKSRLKSNWGEKSAALDCYAEAKLIDPLSSWACYLFAMDNNEEMIECLLYSDSMGVEIHTESLEEIFQRYNEQGENPVIDTEYRRTRVVELLRRLRHDT
jgi:hypothetical protein